MDPFQERLIRIGLAVVGERGFVLGGGHAVQVHGIGARPSEDVDLFSTRRGDPGEVAMDALFNRWAPRDFLDVDAISSSGRYTRDDLLAIAVRHNPGFDSALFAESLSYLREVPLRDFLPYGASEDSVEAMRERFAAWEREIR